MRILRNDWHEIRNSILGKLCLGWLQMHNTQVLKKDIFSHIEKVFHFHFMRVVVMQSWCMRLYLGQYYVQNGSTYAP
jgi:hypothetical protein